MERADTLSAKTILNLMHSFGLDSSRTDKLMDQAISKYESDPDRFDLSDLSHLAAKTLQYYEDKHLRTIFKNKSAEFLEPTFEEVQQDLQATVDRVNSIFVKAYSLKDQMNLLDLKQLFDCVRVFNDIVCECAGLNTSEVLAKYPACTYLLEAIFENTMVLKQTLELPDISLIVKGLSVVAEVQSEESVEFVKEIKYRLKKALEKHRPRGLIDDMKRNLSRLKDHQVLYKTFRTILD